MRLLFATVSPAHYMAPPRLADEQIMCGPDWPDERSPDGRWRSLRTPLGEYDLATVLARLPADQQPDAFVALVDASWRNKPLNTASFTGPRALLVADTHHLQSPLLGMVRYMAAESFDRVVFLYDRHHLGFFQSAGFKNLFWFPGLTFPHSDATVRAARRLRRDPQVAFVGQCGQHHPRRARLATMLQERSLALSFKSLPQSAALTHYGRSLIGFNASLNGDLNLRAFEILASGATLLTDRLSLASGMFDLWTEGRDFICYDSAEDLAERAAHALAHPKETAAIGAAGVDWFDQNFHEQRRQNAFLDLLNHGQSLPEFELPSAHVTRVFFNGDTDQLLPALMVYEGVQELHRTQENVYLAAGPGVSADAVAMCHTLQRVSCISAPTSLPVDMAFFSRTAADVALETDTTRLWCSDAQPQDLAVLGEHLAAAGYAAVSDDVAVFCRALSAHHSQPSQKSPPHVLLYTDDPSSGGVAQYNHSILTALVRSGYRVSCAQTRVDSPLLAEQQALGIEHHWIGFDTRTEFARTMEDHADAQRIFAASKPDFVIFSDCCPVSNLAARQVALDAKLPYLVVVGFVDDYLVDRFKSSLPQLARHYEAAHGVVAVSRHNLKMLIERFGLPEKSGSIIHYGRPEKFFAPRHPATRERLRAELQLPENAVLSLTTARLEQVKGYDFQIAAAQRIGSLPGGERLHFAWAGEGAYRKEIERKIAASGLAGRIHLLGHRWDAADWYDAADMFLLPSLAEGMPLSIMEAMAKGLPVAATAVSGIPEELGSTGKILPDAKQNQIQLVNALATTMVEWTNHPETRHLLGAASRKRAEAMFRESLMIERTLKLLQSHLPLPSQTADPVDEPVARSA